MPPRPFIYCKSATFTCTCCAYSTTIYSDTEWFAVTELLTCDTCKGACDSNHDAGTIYRDDIDTDIPLHMQFTDMPAGKHCCDNCILPGQLHWTELIVQCHYCKKASMLFTAYSIGENILRFYEQCVDNSKPCHPPIEWREKEGGSYYHITGPGRNLSAT